MKLGANHPMGPLALADLVGLDVCLAIMDVYILNLVILNIGTSIVKKDGKRWPTRKKD